MSVEVSSYDINLLLYLALLLSIEILPQKSFEQVCLPSKSEEKHVPLLFVY